MGSNNKREERVAHDWRKTIRPFPFDACRIKTPGCRWLGGPGRQQNQAFSRRGRSGRPPGTILYRVNFPTLTDVYAYWLKKEGYLEPVED